jgi:hypothetical protein
MFFSHHVSNFDTIYCFVEQTLLKTAKKYDVAGRHGAAISNTFCVYLEKDRNANFQHIRRSSKHV